MSIFLAVEWILRSRRVQAINVWADKAISCPQDTCLLQQTLLPLCPLLMASASWTGDPVASSSEWCCGTPQLCPSSQSFCRNWLFCLGVVGGGEKHGRSWQVVNARARCSCDKEVGGSVAGHFSSRKELQEARSCWTTHFFFLFFLSSLKKKNLFLLWEERHVSTDQLCFLGMVGEVPIECSSNKLFWYGLFSLVWRHSFF